MVNLVIEHFFVDVKSMNSFLHNLVEKPVSALQCKVDKSLKLGS